MAPRSQLEKLAPWLIGGAVLVGGALLFSSPGQTSPGSAGDSSSSEPGVDGVNNSSRTSDRPPPDGRRDQPPAPVPLSPPLLFPVEGYRAGRGFGWQQKVFGDGETWHAALDIGAPTGTPVRAVASGRVWDTKSSGDCGTRAQIAHTDPGVPFSFNATYCHLASVIVSNGQHVSKGQVIGYVGETGNTKGAHLHFAMWVEWPHAFDPGPWVGLSGFWHRAFVRNLVLQPVITGYRLGSQFVPSVGWVPIQLPEFGLMFALAA